MKFRISETIHSEKVKTVRLGTAADVGGRYGDADVGKAVKLVGESRYALCAAGDQIEGFISSVNLGTQDGFSVGGIVSTGYKEVTLDGIQLDGTGAIAVGDYVVCGAVSAAGTALNAPLKVRKATEQGDAASGAHKARVVSLGDAGTGAVGTVGVIELF